MKHDVFWLWLSVGMLALRDAAVSMEDGHTQDCILALVVAVFCGFRAFYLCGTDGGEA